LSLALLLFSGNTQAQSPNDYRVPLSKYGALSQANLLRAIADAGGFPAHLYSPRGFLTITNSMTVPSNITLEFAEGAYVWVNTNVMLTLSAPKLMARYSPLFQGSGAVTGTAFAAWGCWEQWNDFFTGNYELTCIQPDLQLSTVGPDILEVGAVESTNLAPDSVLSMHIADNQVGYSELGPWIYEPEFNGDWFSDGEFFSYGGGAATTAWKATNMVTQLESSPGARDGIPTNAMWLLVSTEMQVRDVDGAQVKLSLRNWSGTNANASVWVGGCYATNGFGYSVSQSMIPFYVALGLTNLQYKLDVTQWGETNAATADQLNVLIKVDGWWKAGQ
jgi:hypothetical protein